MVQQTKAKRVYDIYENMFKYYYGLQGRGQLKIRTAGQLNRENNETYPDTERNYDAAENDLTFFDLKYIPRDTSESKTDSDISSRNELIFYPNDTQKNLNDMFYPTCRDQYF